MYFPFLRGKKFEILALREKKDFILHNDIIPVIELVKETNDLKHLIDIPVIIISNPLVGEFKENNTWIENYITNNHDESKNVIMAYQITKLTEKVDIEKFNNKWYGYKKCFIHNYSFKEVDWLLNEYKNEDTINIVDIDYTSTSYLNKVNLRCNKTVVLCDGFDKKDRNIDYSYQSKFNNYCLEYKINGFYGYSDYLTIGRKFTEKGWTPKTIAIHYTHKNKNNDIVIRHFISTESSQEKVIQDKYQEAIAKLIEFIEFTKEDKSEASDIFYNLYCKNKYPGLGKLKQYSIQRHIESIILYSNYSK